MLSQVSFACVLIAGAVNAQHGSDGYGYDAHYASAYGSAPHGDSYGNDHHDDGYSSGSGLAGLLRPGHGSDSFKHIGGDSYGNDHHNSGYGNDHHDSSYGAPHGDSYGNDHHSSPTGYGSHHGSSYGFPWVRRSTIRPRDVKAYNTEPVDNYWKSASKEDETVRASCEFDFLGYSYSSGSLELVQKPYDLTSIIGEFEGLKPGLHALKIHEFGDLEYGCESAGDVYNPFGSYHGQSHEDIHDRRVGDIEHI